MIHSGNYGHLDDLPETVQRAADRLRPHADRFDSIAASGVSGITVAAPVALALGKNLVIVRKDCSRLCWHASEVEGYSGTGSRYVFLDDSMTSGATQARVSDAITRRATRNGDPVPRMAGRYLYGTDELAMAPAEKLVAA